MPVALIPARRPVVGLSLAWGMGTWLAFQVGTPPLGWGMIAGVFLILSSVLLWAPGGGAHGKSDGLSGIVILLAVVFLAGFRTAITLREDGTGTNRWIMTGDAGVSVSFEAEVVGEPEDLPRDPGRRSLEFPVRIVRWLAPGVGVERALPDTLLARLPYIPGRPQPAFGETWRWEGTVRNPLRGIPRLTRLRVGLNPRTAERLAGPAGSSFMGACLEGRRSAAAVLGVGVGDGSVSAGVTRALVLGYRSALTTPMKQLFSQTGTLHVFAISGLHVAMMAVFLVQVLRTLRIASVYWGLLVAPVLVAYTVATGSAPSAIRACLMATVFYLAPLAGRKSDAVSALATSFLVILVVDPVQLFAPGLVLSFVVVAGLVALCPLVDRRFQAVLEPSPLRIQPESRGVQVLRAAGRSLAGLASVSVSAWVVSAPLTAYYFGWFTPVAIISNMVAVPVTSLVLLTGSLSIVLGSAWGMAADILNHANAAFVGFLLWAMRGFLAIPGAAIRVTQLPAWAVWLAYGVLGLAALIWRIRESERAAVVFRVDGTRAGQ